MTIKITAMKHLLSLFLLSFLIISCEININYKDQNGNEQNLIIEDLDYYCGIIFKNDMAQMILLEQIDQKELTLTTSLENIFLSFESFELRQSHKGCVYAFVSQNKTLEVQSFVLDHTVDYPHHQDQYDPSENVEKWSGIVYRAKGTQIAGSGGTVFEDENGLIFKLTSSDPLLQTIIDSYQYYQDAFVSEIYGVEKQGFEGPVILVEHMQFLYFKTTPHPELKRQFTYTFCGQFKVEKNNGELRYYIHNEQEDVDIHSEYDEFNIKMTLNQDFQGCIYGNKFKNKNSIEALDILKYVLH